MLAKIRTKFEIGQHVADAKDLSGVIKAIDVKQTYGQTAILDWPGPNILYYVANDKGAWRTWRNERDLHADKSEKLSEAVAWAHCSASITRNIMAFTYGDALLSPIDLLGMPDTMKAIKREAYEPLWKNGIKVTSLVKGKVNLLIEDIAAFCTL